jgi:colanic acid biosynthesis glycosyl transferase WcaI
MRILLLNQFFWPDSAPTSVLLTDLARELASRGHDVVAVCGNSNYVASTAKGEVASVEVRRTPTLKFAHGTAARLLSYTSFMGTALGAGLTGEKPDLVITLTTPPLLSAVGTILKNLRGCRHWIWEMDVYPDVAVELGWIKKNGSLERLIGFMTDWPRQKADGILVLGECMKQRLMDRGVADERLFVAENWADGREINPLPFPDKGLLQVLYSGNLGLAHEVETIEQAAWEMDENPVAEFVFAGGGRRRKRLEERCAARKLKHVTFRGYSSAETLGESLGKGDIGLVTQRLECIGTVVPSKVYALLAAGRPVLYIGPEKSTPHRIIEKFRCGWHIHPGDVRGVKELLNTLAGNRRLVYEAGNNARRAFLENYDLPIGVGRIADLIGARPLEVERNTRGSGEMNQWEAKTPAIV